MHILMVTAFFLELFLAWPRVTASTTPGGGDVKTMDDGTPGPPPKP